MGSLKDDISLVERVEAVWSSMPKDKVETSRFGAITVVSLAYDVQGIWILHWIQIGQRRGIIEQLVAIDPEVSQMVDRLVCQVEVKPWNGLSSLADYVGDLRSIKQTEMPNFIADKMRKHADWFRAMSRERLMLQLDQLSSACGQSVATLPGCYGTSPRR